MFFKDVALKAESWHVFTLDLKTSTFWNSREVLLSCADAMTKKLWLEIKQEFPDLQCCIIMRVLETTSMLTLSFYVFTFGDTYL